MDAFKNASWPLQIISVFYHPPSQFTYTDHPPKNLYGGRRVGEMEVWGTHGSLLDEMGTNREKGLACVPAGPELQWESRAVCSPCRMAVWLQEWSGGLSELPALCAPCRAVINDDMHSVCNTQNTTHQTSVHPFLCVTNNNWCVWWETDKLGGWL